ncbi:hypothetical protein EMCG_03475 [[Emmonsia] crescens]|uniref:Life-span regulatory factor domain-containing protein n=1 Tax=[Emmonsia] crescens TaxID=73230 RepID=A0A0G2J047_9EURO|nr:hypothetical protein EMCG_03475 [Emmonsia crescens UAMH 3008]
MATAFLQFCATCERQIMIPSDSILYCSESCRRQDSSKPPEISRVTTRTMTSSKHSPPASPLSIVAPMVPTQPASCSPSPLIRIPANNHEGASELDPTEWKPKMPLRPTNPPVTSSEASRYLSLFQKPEPPSIVTDNGNSITACKTADENNNHNNNNSNNTNNNNNDDDDDTVYPRPVSISHHSSASISTTGQGTLPSLAHSPTTSAASSLLLDSPTEPAACVPTTSTIRPPPPPHPYLLPESATHQRSSLPPRHNPSTSTTRDFDLAMPYIIADANDEVVPAAAVKNEKRTTAAAAAAGGGCFLRQEKLVRLKLAEHSSVYATPEPGRPTGPGLGHGQVNMD